jgi:hypothetical protein
VPAAPQEDGIYQDASGQHFQLKNGQWSPYTFSSDVKNAEPAAAGRGLLQLATTPFSLGDLTAQGVGAGASKILGPQSGLARGAEAVHEAFGPMSYGQMSQDLPPQLRAQAVTPGGKFLQTLTEWAPSIVAAAPFSPEEMIPALVRGGLGAVGSEGLGQATEGTKGEPIARLAGGMLAGLAPTGPRFSGVNPERLVQAQAASKLGPVSNADVTGSRLWATLEGKPPVGQEGAFSEGMLAKEVQPADVATTRSGTLANVFDRLDAQVKDLKSNTRLYPDQLLNNDLATRVGNYTLKTGGPGQSIYDPAVKAGYDTYLHLTNGGLTPLTGDQYWTLANNWKNSNVPELQGMGYRLDNAMDNSNNGAQYNGAWQQWRTAYGNLKGLQAAHDPADALAPLSPGKVSSAIMRDTDLKNQAASAQTILNSRPQPYNIGGAGDILGGILGTAGLGYGAAHGGIAGAEAASLPGFFGPHYMGKAAQYLAGKTAPFFSSAPVQAAGARMSPQTMNTIMALRGPNAVQGLLETPQQGQQ